MYELQARERSHKSLQKAMPKNTQHNRLSLLLTVLMILLSCSAICQYHIIPNRDTDVRTQYQSQPTVNPYLNSHIDSSNHAWRMSRSDENTLEEWEESWFRQLLDENHAACRDSSWESLDSFLIETRCHYNGPPILALQMRVLQESGVRCSTMWSHDLNPFVHSRNDIRPRWTFCSSGVGLT